MILREGKFVEAVYTNDRKNSIEAVWVDAKTEQHMQIVIQPNLQDRLYVKLLEQFSIDDINEMTASKKERESAAFLALVKKMAVESGMIYDPNAKDKKASLNLDNIFNPSDDEAGGDLLFNIKLKIFDLPEVASSTDTSLKKELRMADTPLKAFYIAGKFLYK